MAYNIDTWRTTSLVNFTIPLSIVQQLPCAEIEILLENKISVYGGVSGGFVLQGTLLLDGNICVEKIHHSGSSSGRTWYNLLDALHHSKGIMVATQVWEGGDSISRLVVKDGVVEEENIEL